MKKILLSGLVAGIVMLIVGAVASYLLDAIIPGVKAEYANAELFRSWSNPLINPFYLYSLIVGFVLAWVWNMTKPVFKECKRQCCCCPCGSGVGFVYWLAASVPMMFLTFASFQISFLMALSWTTVALLQMLAGSAVVAKMNK